MATLTERLEIRLPSQTIRLLRQEAERRHVSLAKLVREAIDLLLEHDREMRMRAAQDLFQVEAPVSDWSTMKKEIEESHSEGDLP